ncbi:MAG: tol-pal system protein YbgF [Nitrospinae bacterium]|nr:tol-pal system protein YbgF [Nitrospinota bacterium]
MIRISYLSLPILFFSLFSTTLAQSQPITNKTISEQLLIFENRVLDKMDDLSKRINKLEKGGTSNELSANKSELRDIIDSLQKITGKFEEFSYTLTSLQQQLESMSKSSQQTNTMFQQALEKTSKGGSSVDKDLTYQVSTIKMTLQDLSYKLYQTEDTLSKQLASIQEKMGLTVFQEPKKNNNKVSKEKGERKKEEKKIIVSSMSMEDSYKTAYNDYLKQNYDLAITGFTTFLQNFSETSLSDNAQYWIGESYYSQEKYKMAINAFNELIKQYPHSNKLPETKYKIARSYHLLKDKDKALAAYKEVIQKFSGTSMADRAQEYVKEIEEGKTATN